MRNWAERLKDIGYERTRRALALLPLGFFTTVYMLVALSAPPGWGPAIFGLGVCYLVGFLALGAEWFWGRWYASGLGWSGLMVGVYALVSVGWVPQLVIYTVLHGLTVVCLMGPKMGALYENRAGWRERYGLDEYGVGKLGKAVTRAAGSLPAIVLWVLQPRDPHDGGTGSALWTVVAVIAALLAVSGLFEILKLRTWGVLALAAAAVLALLAPGFHAAAMALTREGGFTGIAGMVAWCADDWAALWLAAAVAPFVGPVVRRLRSAR
jgi:hypothetical protein